MSRTPDLSDGESDFVAENGSPIEHDPHMSPFVNVLVQGSQEGPPKVRLMVSARERTRRVFLYPVFDEHGTEELIRALERALTYARSHV